MLSMDRAYAACQILAALVANHPAENHEVLVSKAVQYADALLKCLASTNATPVSPSSATDVVVHDATWEEPGEQTIAS
jgi:hypothetical protein